MNSFFLLQNENIIKGMKNELRNDTVISYEGGYIIRFKGVVIYKSNSVGEKSVVAFFSDYLQGCAKLDELFGFFWIIASNEKESIFLCDNSGMMPLYYYSGKKYVVSDSLISLAEFLGLTPNDLDKNNIVSFLEFGFCFSGSTFFSSVKRCSGQIIYRITDEGVLECQQKEIKPIKEKFNAQDFSERILTIIRAFTNVIEINKEISVPSKTKLVIDCTGGYDSRLLIGLASKINLDFDLFVRGHENCADIFVAQKIAQILKKKLIVCEAKPLSDFSLEHLTSLWRQLDGTCSLFDGSQFIDAMKMKKRYGFVYSLGGFAGGEYFRNYIVLRRGKKGTYARSLCNYNRIRVVGINKTIYQEYQAMIEEVVRSCDATSKMAANVDLYRREIFPNRSGPVYGVSSDLCPAYGPLGENLFAVWAQKLPFYKKWYSIIYRKILYKNKNLATLSTIYGTNLSLSPISLLHDVALDIVVFTRRVFSKIFTKKMWKPTSFYVSAVTDCSEFKKTDVYQNMISSIDELNIFDSKNSLLLSVNKVLDRFLLLYLWINFLKKNK